MSQTRPFNKPNFLMGNLTRSDGKEGQNSGCEHTRKTAAYIAAALGQALPGEVANRARLHLLDTVAAIVFAWGRARGKARRVSV
jgi:hypothetical protein